MIITCMMIVYSVLPLSAQQSDVFTVDHHHMVSTVSHGMIHCFISSLQHLQSQILLSKEKKFISTLVIVLAEVKGFCHLAS